MNQRTSVTCSPRSKKSPINTRWPSPNVQLRSESITPLPCNNFLKALKFPSMSEITNRLFTFAYSLFSFCNCCFNRTIKNLPISSVPTFNDKLSFCDNTVLSAFTIFVPLLSIIYLAKTLSFLYCT